MARASPGDSCLRQSPTSAAGRIKVRADSAGSADERGGGEVVHDRVQVPDHGGEGARSERRVAPETIEELGQHRGDHGGDRARREQGHTHGSRDSSVPPD